MTSSNFEEALSDDPSQSVSIDRMCLADIAKRYHEQAADLRRKAVWNIRSIVMTVLLMAVAVVVLPPLVNVVEDRILALFGYETSHIDFNQESARQAASVRSYSNQLLQILQERDSIISVTQNTLGARLTSFKGESLRGEAGNPATADIAFTADFGVLGGTLEKNGIVQPLIAFWSEDGKWTAWDGFEDGTVGAINRIKNVGKLFYAVGQLENRATFWSIDSSTKVKLNFSAADDDLEYFHDFSVSEDNKYIALSASAGARSNNKTIIVLDIEEQYVKVKSYDFQIFGEISDLIWEGQDLLLAHHDPGGAKIYRIINATGGDGELKARVHTVSGEVQTIPENELDYKQIGFAPSRILKLSKNDLGNIFALLTKHNEVQYFFYNANGEWSGNRKLFPGFEALFPSEIAADEKGIYFIRRNDISFISTNTNLSFSENGDFSTKLRMNLDYSISPIFIGPKGRLIITNSQNPSLNSYLYFIESKSLSLPELTKQDGLTRFLEGLVPEEGELPLGGDKTSSAANLLGGRDMFRRSIAATQKAIRDSDMLLDNSIHEGTEKLDALSEKWVTQWDEREKAAIILSRLRAADHTGSTWRNVSSLTARLAVIALLVYLVNILVNLYRYNMRLAAFYQARGDAMETALASGCDIGTMMSETLSEFARAYTPEEVNFGTRPAPPTETIAKTFQELAKVLKS